MEFLFALLFAILPPCATEDSPNCAWNDGTGNAIINIGNDYTLTEWK